MQKRRVAVWLMLCGVSFAIFAATPTNFQQAKKLALSIFESKPVTLYCGCHFNHDKFVNLEACQMHQAIPVKRANKIEWEHMMPASQFGKHLECWHEDICFNQKKNKAFHGRKCCEQLSSEFRTIEAELYNLWPSIGAINQARLNYEYAEIDNKRGFYGCAFDIDKVKKVAEPPDRAKGVVARANLFMSWRYGVVLLEDYKQRLTDWNRQYPPSKWEIEWANRVAQQEGYCNPFIKFYNDPRALSQYLANHIG